MTIKVEEIKLKSLIKESVKEAMNMELMKLRAFLLGNVSAKEQRDIEKRYGSPSRKRAISHTLNV